MRTDGIENITELSQVFEQITVLFKVLDVNKNWLISSFTNCFNWYLSAFCLSCFSHLIDCRRFCALMLNGSINQHNCNYRALQDPYVTLTYQSLYYGLLSLLNGISIFEGYLIQKPSLKKASVVLWRPNLGK